MTILGGLGFRETGKHRKKIFMRPRDLQSTTWYMNRVRLRNWDHSFVVVKTDGKELRVRKGKKGGWTVWMLV